MALAASLSGTCCVFLLRYLDAELSNVILERDNDTQENSQYIMSTCRSKLEQVLRINDIPQSMLDALWAACDDFQPLTRPLFAALLFPSSKTLRILTLAPFSRSLMAQVASELKEGLCHLDMGANRIGDSFIDALSLSSASKTLKTFRTSASAFTDATKSCWRRFVSLSEISIRDNDFISSATLNEISALPNLSRIAIEVFSMSSCAVIASIVRSTTVRHIDVPVIHEELDSLPKIIKLFSQWQAADQLEVFQTGESRGWWFHERDVTEFAKYCPKASLQGLVYRKNGQQDTAASSDTPFHRSAPPKSLYEILHHGELNSLLNYRSSVPEEWPHQVAMPDVVTQIHLDFSLHGFRSASDRGNLINTLKSGKNIVDVDLRLNTIDGLSADEIHEMLLSLPKLKIFAVSCSNSCAEVYISHGSLSMIPSFYSSTRAIVRWLPSVRELACPNSTRTPLSPASCFPGLTSLNIDIEPESDLGNVGSYLSQLQKLVAAKLPCWPSNAPDFCKIQTIYLSQLKGDQPSMEQIIRSCPLLLEFVINRQPPGHRLAQPIWEIQNLDWLRHKRLQRVSLSYCLITQPDYTFEMSVETLPSLTDFDLRWSKTVVAFNIHDMPYLSHLSLHQVRGDNQRIRVERCAELSDIVLFPAQSSEELGEVIIQDNPNLRCTNFFGYKYNDAEKNGKVQLQASKRREVADVQLVSEDDKIVE